MKKRKNYKLKKTSNGYTITVDTPLIVSRDTHHFQHQLNTRMQVVEDKRKKKDRYKKDYSKDYDC